MLKLSIVIPIYNEQKTLETLIAKVNAVNYDKEIITVDAKSGTIISEGTISIVGLPDEYNK